MVISAKLLQNTVHHNNYCHEIPIVLDGDFNINFASDTSRPLVQFLNDEFNLEMSNNPQQSTTKHSTTIDAIFTRFLQGVETKLNATYFSYHKPLISIVPI